MMPKNFLILNFVAVLIITFARLTATADDSLPEQFCFTREQAEELYTCTEDELLLRSRIHDLETKNIEGPQWYQTPLGITAITILAFTLGASAQKVVFSK